MKPSVVAIHVLFERQESTLRLQSFNLPATMSWFCLNLQESISLSVLKSAKDENFQGGTFRVLSQVQLQGIEFLCEYILIFMGR